MLICSFFLQTKVKEIIYFLFVDYGNTAIVAKEVLYPLDDLALLGIPPMSYHCHLCEVTCTDGNDNWPEDVKLIFFLSFPLSFSPSFPFYFLNLQMHRYHGTNQMHEL